MAGISTRKRVNILLHFKEIIMEKPNLLYIESMSRGDDAFTQKILDVVKKEFPQELEIYKNNYKEGNYITASENVHKIKHKISLLGLEKSYEVATCYENNLKENITDFHDDFEEIMQMISDYLLTF